jgi:hypothetical protein
LPLTDTSELYFCNVSETITMAMEQLDELLLHNPELPGYDQLEFDITETARLIGSVYFQPDEWLSHMDELIPVLCSRDAGAIPGHVRARLKEVYRSFIFGNWIACIALSRALLEYVLLDRRNALSIDVFEDPENTQRVRRLSNLVDQASQTRPELGEAMSHVQQYGNEVMHPKLRRNVDSYLPGKRQAKDCLQKVRLVVASLYT